MKCIMLVGGYATRMYPVTKSVPKALLEFNKKTILDNILESLFKDNDLIDEYILITNDTFLDNFNEWYSKVNYDKKITIVSDGSTSLENKIGAATAVSNFLIKNKIDDDILIMAGDNILDFSLNYIFDNFKNNNNSCIMYYEEMDKKRLSKTGVIEIDDNSFIKSMEEKPEFPKTNYAVPPFYWLKKNDVKKFVEIFKDLEKIDSMGAIILNLCSNTSIKAIKMNGHRYDVGSLDEYNKLK